jgi:IMP cyclohydrolase
MVESAALLIPGDAVEYRHDDYNDPRVGVVSQVSVDYRGRTEVHLVDSATGEPYVSKATRFKMAVPA